MPMYLMIRKPEMADEEIEYDIVEATSRTVAKTRITDRFAVSSGDVIEIYTFTHVDAVTVDRREVVTYE